MQVSVTTLPKESVTVQVIVALPFFAAYTLPFLSTVATLVFDYEYLKVYSAFASALIVGLRVVEPL